MNIYYRESILQIKLNKNVQNFLSFNQIHLNVNFYRIIKNKLHKSKWSQCGYIISNFPETIEQTQNIFNLEHFTMQNENNLQTSKDDFYPCILQLISYNYFSRYKV